jgi:hypothetical protein
MKLIINKVFWVILLTVTSIYGCQNRPENNSKCSCLPVGHAERVDSKDDNEYVIFQNSKRNFIIELVYLRSEKDNIIYTYTVMNNTNGEMKSMYDYSTIAKVNCKKGEIEFFGSKKFNAKNYPDYEGKLYEQISVYHWRIQGLYKIDKESNLHALGYRTPEQFKDLIHVESY